MQTVTSPILPSSVKSVPKVAKASESRGSDFAENLQQAKQKLSNSSQNRTDTADKPVQETASNDTVKHSHASNGHPSSQKAEQTASADAGSQPEGAQGNGKTTKAEAASPSPKADSSSGNKLQQEGQNLSDGESISSQESNVAAKIKGEKVSKNAAQQAPELVGSEAKQAAKVAPISASQDVRIGKDGKPIFPKGDQIVTTSDGAKVVIPENASIKIGKDGKPIFAGQQVHSLEASVDGTHSLKASADGAQAGKGAVKGETKADRLAAAASVIGVTAMAGAVTDGKMTDGKITDVKGAQTPTKGAVSDSAKSATTDAGNAEAAASAGAAATMAGENGVAQPADIKLAANGEVSQDVAAGADSIQASTVSTDATAQSGEQAALSDKVPPEVRALHAKEGKTTKTAAGLAALGVGAKALTRTNAAKDTADATSAVAGAVQAHTTDAATATAAETTANGNGELSWVLSQMGNAAPTATASGTTATASGTTATVDAAGKHVAEHSAVASSTPLVGTKVADQVALANTGTVAQQPPSPLILGDGTTTAAASLASLGGLALASGADGDKKGHVELRKKEQDALISKMTAADASQKGADIGGLGSSLQSANNPAGRLSAALAPNLQGAPQGAQQNLAMNVPPNHPGWAGEMSQKVAWVAQAGGHSAHIKLDPPELGSLTVKVSVDSDNNTQVSFVAATPQAKELLDNQMGRLREMLAQQGMDLSSVDVGVSQQNTSGNQYQGTEQGGNSDSNLGSFLTKGEEESAVPQNISYVSPSGIDYYA